MRPMIAAAAALLLAACGSQDGNEQATKGENGKAASAGGGSAVSLQPGLWETTVQFSEFQVPGVPEAMVNQMREAMGQPQTDRECITPEEAANPAGEMLKGDDDENCEFSDSTFAGGTIRVRGTCRDPSGATATMSLEGSFTPTTMQARLTTEQSGAAGMPAGQSMRMSGAFSSRRVGECPAEEQ